MRGIEEYKTTAGAPVMSIHYSADPDKNTETEQGRKWYKHFSTAWPGGPTGPKWRQEMEIDFGAMTGQRVFADFDELSVNVIIDPPDVDDNIPLYASYDYGIHFPCSWGIYAVFSLDDIVKIDEIVESHTPAAEQARLLKRKPYFPLLRGIIGDPSIWNRSQHKGSELVSIGDLLAEEGVHVDRGRNEPGVDLAFINLLKGNLWNNKERPKYRISSRCKQTIRCYRRLAWRDPSPNTQVELREGIIRRYVDPFDSDKYFLLSQGLDEPGVIDYRPGTWGWHEEQLNEAARAHGRVLG